MNIRKGATLVTVSIFSLCFSCKVKKGIPVKISFDSINSMQSENYYHTPQDKLGITFLTGFPMTKYVVRVNRKVAAKATWNSSLPSQGGMEITRPENGDTISVSNDSLTFRFPYSTGYPEVYIDFWKQDTVHVTLSKFPWILE